MYLRTNYIGATLILISIFLGIKLEYPLFLTPHTTIIRDSSGKLLSTQIAEDYQWRFPPSSSIPTKFEKSILLFEDRYFKYNFGIDFTAIIRALYLNIKHGEVVSGASTISMQVIRLSRLGKNRTVKEKIIEMILSLKLELLYSKDEILNLYASYAPFGGNVVGLEAASWRYYSRPPENLSWGETAALAVLPNAPALIYPGRNENPFLIKRNKLLLELLNNSDIDEQTYKLAILEPLPSKPNPIPNKSRHLLNRVIRDGYSGQDLITTIDRNIQSNLINIVDNHVNTLKQKGIFNSSAIVVEIESGNVLAYVGNSSPNGSTIHSNSVDIISSKRSPGSILKPILYGLSIDDGIITPGGYLYDTPLYYKGFKPENYTNSFTGISNADIALQKSLNIPFVNLLNDYGYTRFYDKLSMLGLKFPESSDHYGLTMILGGAETTLWDLCSTYASAARTLNIYNNERILTPETFHPLSYLSINRSYINSDNTYISPGALHSMFSAMTKLTRPNSLGNWQSFESSYPIAWKTGTSTGFKDAWAIGLTHKYLVGVWSGNADGEGRAELVGVKAAAPILFDIFKILPQSKFFTIPTSDMSLRKVCKDSGYLASSNCNNSHVLLLPNSNNYPVCSFHTILHLDENEKFQVKAPYPQYKMVNKSWLLFDPVTSWYFEKYNSSYIPPPPMTKSDYNTMEFIYPSKSTMIYVPIEIDGAKGSTVFEVAHSEETTLYWHLDEEYIGKTDTYHQMKISPKIGKHKITILDSDGSTISRLFEIIK